MIGRSDLEIIMLLSKPTILNKDLRRPLKIKGRRNKRVIMKKIALSISDILFHCIISARKL